MKVVNTFTFSCCYPVEFLLETPRLNFDSRLPIYLAMAQDGDTLGGFAVEREGSDPTDLISLSNLVKCS